jgi:uncharacterized protein YprB with RNaseH-like and TPR domain
MTVKDLIDKLLTCEPVMFVEIEQAFRDNKSCKVVSIEIERGRLILKDHFVKGPQSTKFTAFNGIEFDVPPLPERLMRRNEI